MSALSISAGLLGAFLLISWLCERHSRKQADGRIKRLEQGLRASVERELDANRRANELAIELRCVKRRHSLPMLGLPHHRPGPIYRN